MRSWYLFLILLGSVSIGCSDSTEPGDSVNRRPDAITDLRVRLIHSSGGVLRVEFTAPSDPDHNGPVSRYELRQSTYRPDADDWWDSLTFELPTALPSPPGESEEFLVGGIQSGVRTYAIRSYDEFGLSSETSNLTIVVITDTIPPAAVDNLEVEIDPDRTPRVSFKWTGDDGLDGIAARYYIRWNREPLTGSNWDTSEGTYSDNRRSTSGGQVFSGLSRFEPGTYFFGVRIADEADNLSSMSNIVNIVVE